MATFLQIRWCQTTIHNDTNCVRICVFHWKHLNEIMTITQLKFENFIKDNN